MAQALTSQMNIRIGSQLKQRGDVALAQLGYTASETVRAVWALAASGGRGMDLLANVLGQGAKLEQAKSLSTADALAEPMPWELFDTYAAQLGSGIAMQPIVCSDSDLLEEETFERMQEKGLL